MHSRAPRLWAHSSSPNGSVCACRCLKLRESLAPSLSAAAGLLSQHRCPANAPRPLPAMPGGNASGTRHRPRGRVPETYAPAPVASAVARAPLLHDRAAPSTVIELFKKERIAQRPKFADGRVTNGRRPLPTAQFRTRSGARFRRRACSCGGLVQRRTRQTCSELPAGDGARCPGLTERRRGRRIG